MTEEKTWAIIGGGILGMTLAVRLNEAGYKVTIFESAEKVGGLTSAWRMPVRAVRKKTQWFGIAFIM